MKKHMLGTTALVAAGLLAYGAAGQANAQEPAAGEEEAKPAEPIDGMVSGYYNSVFQIFGQDTPGVRSNAVGLDGEVHFGGSTTLDNGLSVAVRIELERVNTDSAIDENWVDFSGAFGSLRVGNDDSAGYRAAYVAPSAGLGVNSPTFAILGANGNTAGTATFLGLGGDGDKLTYFTPRFNGVQLGVSYQPDDSTAQTSANSGGAADTGADAQGEILSLGANYVQSTDDWNVAVSFGIAKGNNEQPSAGRDDDTAYVFGLNLGFDAFVIGGSVFHDDRGRDSGGDRDAVDIGATFGAGDATFSLNYLHSSTEQGVGVQDDDVDIVGVGLTYAIGPGVRLISSLKYYDYTSVVLTENVSGYTFGIGTGVSF